MASEFVRSLAGAEPTCRRQAKPGGQKRQFALSGSAGKTTIRQQFAEQHADSRRPPSWPAGRPNEVPPRQLLTRAEEFRALPASCWPMKRGDGPLIAINSPAPATRINSGRRAETVDAAL